MHDPIHQQMIVQVLHRFLRQFHREYGLILIAWDRSVAGYFSFTSLAVPWDPDHDTPLHPSCPDLPLTACQDHVGVPAWSRAAAHGLRDEIAVCRVLPVHSMRVRGGGDEAVALGTTTEHRSASRRVDHRRHRPLRAWSDHAPRRPTSCTAGRSLLRRIQRTIWRAQPSRCQSCRP